MVRNKIIMATVIILLLTGSTYFMVSVQQSQPCDKIIEFNDGRKVSCKFHNSYENGMTHYRDCQNKKVEVPTITIKYIK